MVGARGTPTGRAGISRRFPARAILVEQKHRLLLRATRARSSVKGAMSISDKQPDLALARRQCRTARGPGAARPRTALAASSRCWRSRRVALVEDQEHDLLGHRPGAAPARRHPGHLERNAPASVLLARTIRCATVASGTRNAARSRVLHSPPSIRSVSATRASLQSTGGDPERLSLQPGLLLRRDGQQEADLGVLVLQALRPAHEVDRANARRWSSAGRPGLSGDARSRPLSEGGDERVLREVLDATSAHLRQRAIRRPHAPDGLDRAPRRCRSVTPRLCCGRAPARELAASGCPQGSRSSRRSRRTSMNGPSPITVRLVDGLLAVLGWTAPVAADQFLGFAERAVGDAGGGDAEGLRSPSPASSAPALVSSSL